MKKILSVLAVTVVLFSLFTTSSYAIWPFDQIKDWLRKKIVKEWQKEKRGRWEMPFGRWTGPERPPRGKGPGWQFWGRMPKRIWAGEVKSVGRDQFTLITNKGEEKTVLVDEKTMYHLPQEKWEGSFSDLKVGSKVRVFGPPTDGEIKANRVIILPEKPTVTPSVKPTLTSTPTPKEL